MGKRRREVVALSLVAAAACGVTVSHGASGAGSAEPIRATVTVDTRKVLREMDPRKLGGTNAAFWNSKECFTSPVVNRWLREMQPGLIRIPGGSYSDHIYWNGHGVRGQDGKVDPTRMKEGYPDVNYADGVYEPSFTADRSTHTPGQSAAQNVDVKTMHEFVRSVQGTGTLAVTNAGTGRAVDAAEWVRWANLKMGYGVEYWEVGNELDGDWEPGHILPDGRHMTGEIYAARFHEFARAMKAVDPKVKVGGATTGAGEESFSKEMLRLSGEDVDFVSIHTYPGTRLKSDDEAFADIPRIVGTEVGAVKKWIREYQPKRADQIEIVYSEWNLTDQPGDFCSDTYSALWASAFLAEMARNGVTAATDWDLFTHTGDSTGFAMFHNDHGTFIRKSQYYAFQLWNNFTGRQLLAAEASGSPRVKAFASRSGDDAYVMLLNIDRDCDAQVRLKLDMFDAAPTGEQAMLTSREYFWPAKGKKPLWSEGIRVEPLATAGAFEVKLAPFSINYVHVARKGSAAAQTLAARGQGARPAAPAVEAVRPELRFIIEPRMYAGDLAEGVVVALEPRTGKAFPRALPAAKLSADGEAGFDRAEARLTEAVGRFSIRPAAPGSLKLTAASGGVTATTTLEVRASIPRPVLLWDFRDPIATDKEMFSSDWVLANDEGMRPNKGVARIDLPAEGVIPAGGKAPRTVLMVRRLPPKEQLNRDNIRGVFFDLALSPGFRSDDPDASLQVVMQTPLKGYWMPLGSVKLMEQADGKWRRHQIDVTDESSIKAMGGVYNLWFVLGSSKPVKGSLYLDQIGLMVR